MPIRLTAKQKMAMVLERKGKTHKQIADEMGLKNRESASQLLARARRAAQAIREEFQRFLED